MIKEKLHSITLYPLILVFAYSLKGKKNEYKDFFINDKKDFEKEEILKIVCKNYSFFDKIKLFFDKNSPLYDKTFVSFNIDVTESPEENKLFLFDFSEIINIFHSMSMLSKKIPNENIFVDLTFDKRRFSSSEIDNFLRYALLIYASRKVDKLCINKAILKDEKCLLAYETMISYLDNSTIEKYSKSKDLNVITCKKNKKKFDIIWSSNREIELTDFDKVYDKFGNQLTTDIKITTSPIYAYHK